MIKVGIDSISFYTSQYYLDLKTLATARGIDEQRFYRELGQHKMAVSPPGEDVVTLAANAASNLLASRQDNSDIAMLLFATETGIDQSKAAGMYVHQLLNLPSNCRVLELKQACYAGTGAVQLALPFLRQYPHKKVLCIAVDIAKYPLESAAESSQGAGAIAMLLSAEPRMLNIEPESGICAREAADFWRPNYCDVAMVDGKLSCSMYLQLLDECWHAYTKISGRSFKDHDFFCYHTPVPKLVESAHRRLAKINRQSGIDENSFANQVGASLIYSHEVGNVYTASLYMGILSLLENSGTDIQGKRLGLYSYGSGSEGEYFSAVVSSQYQKMLQRELHTSILSKRQELTFQEYLNFYEFKLPKDGSALSVPASYNTGKFKLTRIAEHKRFYTAI